MSIFKKNIKTIIVALLIGVLIWFVYDIHFKYTINEYQGHQIEKQLKKDFAKNSKGFEMVREFQSELGNISDLQFSRTDNYIRFEIKSDSFPADIYDWIHVSAGETSQTDIKFIGISEKDSIVAEYENEQFKIGKPWVISFEGKKSNPDLKQILSLKNIDLEDLNTIQILLNATNSIGFEKNDSIVKLQYAGHWGESYNYVLPIKNLNQSVGFKKISENWYSLHYQNGLFCGYTDW
jgi:hypothetical protein